MNNDKLAQLLHVDRKILPANGGDLYNRLIFARSPYLLQHAENPVDWREWGDEAFAEARRRDVPLFVSIGYATCHWCHVMVQESFNDGEVAAILNESFVPVKIDREERPDLDDFYMTAARVLTGGGGWPLNVFIDHDSRPFFSLTYLPKYPRHRTPGFMDLLRNIATLWREKREMVFSNATEIVRSLAAYASNTPATGKDLDWLSKAACQHLAEMYDHDFCGFGRVTKFPMPLYLLFLLSRDNKVNVNAPVMALKTLEKMMCGGIHDQLGGGFHRYTVDQKWNIPHFEKMLYDQAMLILAYVEAFKVSADSKFLETAEKTADFAYNELLTDEGAFCAALDADSEGEEGFFYTWRYEELTAILGSEYNSVLDFWGARCEGDLDGRCILHTIGAPDKFAGERGISEADLKELIVSATQKLLIARALRERPLRDLKVICAWNGLMIAALVRLFAASGKKKWLERAEKAAGFIISKMVNSTGMLCRNWLGTPTPVAAFAEDYACFCLGLTELANQNPDSLWKDRLEHFAHELSVHFVTDAGDVIFSGIDGHKLPQNIPAVQDGVMPSAAGLCAVVLIRAGLILDNRVFTEKGREIIGRYRGLTEQNPSACLTLIMAEEGLFLKL